MSGPAETTWSTCPLCGDARPPGVAACPTCGKKVEPTTKGSPRRLAIHRYLRIGLVVAVGAILAGSVIDAEITGPPTAADALTGKWTYALAPGNHSVLSGPITGGDYIQGNFTVLYPPGAVVEFEVLNMTYYQQFLLDQKVVPEAPPVNETSGLILFSPDVTDTYYFVWVDNYPVGSGIALNVYVTANYESNVLVS